MKKHTFGVVVLALTGKDCRSLQSFSCFWDSQIATAHEEKINYCNFKNDAVKGFFFDSGNAFPTLLDMPFLNGTNGTSKVTDLPIILALISMLKHTHLLTQLEIKLPFKISWLFGPIRTSALLLLDQSETAHQVLFFSQQANSRNLSGKTKLIFYLWLWPCSLFGRWGKERGRNTNRSFVAINHKFHNLMTISQCHSIALENENHLYCTMLR